MIYVASISSHVQLCFMVLWSFICLLSFELAEAMGLLEILHLLHCQQHVGIHRLLSHDLNSLFHQSLIYCHMLLSDINNKEVYPREDFQSLEVICKIITLSQ